jgi:NAD(P)-dependent dehydrogenase (short-subunit alcohol dehydrogenase family)
MMLKDKIALVTGANRGIGREIARQLALKEARVIMTARNEEAGQKTERELSKEPLDIKMFTLDVTDNEQISELAGFIDQKFGHLDILINNAAILIDNHYSALTISAEDIRRTMETNLIGPLRLCQTTIPLMKKHNYGRIINLSSGMGAFSEMGGGNPAYRISKTALNALTKILASELSGTNIKINSMCPGWVRTGMGGQSAPRTVSQGADTAIWLSDLPDNGPSGKFFRDRNEIPW